MAEPIGRHIVIGGFTSSKKLIPWGDPSVEIWIVNNCWKFVPPTWHRLYDLHETNAIREDKEHDAFLRGQTQRAADGQDARLGNRPLYVLEPQPEWPNALEFPADHLVTRYNDYVTNSITWLVFHALAEMEDAAGEFAGSRLAEMEDACEDAAFFEMVKPGLAKALLDEYLARCTISIYGVDMATGGEYASQRPSVENAIGWAQGKGITVTIPPSSDLLKLTATYGSGADAGLYAKCVEREAELTDRGRQLEQQIGQAQAALAQVQGALETTRYFKEVWCNPRARSRHEDAPQNSNGHVSPEIAEAVLEAV